MKLSVKVRNELPNFLSKLYVVKDIAQITLDLIAQKGLEIAKEYWGDNAKVFIEKNGDLSRSIVAEGYEVAFIEFGYGREGEGTYKGNLPTDTITFEHSDGEIQSTQGWEYYYDSKYKVTVDGIEGWWKDENGLLTFHIGDFAKMPMLKTYERLSNYVKTELHENVRRKIEK